MIRTVASSKVMWGHKKKKRARRSLSFFVLAVLVATSIVGVLLAATNKPAHALPTTFTVNWTGDGGDATPDGACDSHPSRAEVVCTLREAIQEANASPGADTIAFAIVEFVGTGLKTIRPVSPLPPITEPVTIDGYTQPGANPNTRAKGTNAELRIELDGSNLGFSAAAVGLDIRARNTVVRGLVINRFDRSGIQVLGPTTIGVRIAGCFIGTDAAGTGDPDPSGRPGAFGGDAVVIDAPAAIVGGASRADRNLISLYDRGVILLAGAGGSRVQGNLIGTDRSGTVDLGNFDSGVYTTATNTVIGGDGDAANIIAFNVGDGGGDGVTVKGGTGNRILSNSIFSNGGLGIDLNNGDGVTPNDSDDHDLGPNTLQNYPVLRSATTNVTVTTIAGRLNSTPSRTFVLRFFANPAGENEGKSYLGEQSVTTNAFGNVAFTFVPDQTVAVGKTITATATGPGGNTSEFSKAKRVEPPPIGGA